MRWDVLEKLARAVKGIGSVLGIGSSVAPQITWSEEKPAGDAVPIVFRIGDLKLSNGLHRLRFQITDAISGAVIVTERLIRVKG